MKLTKSKLQQLIKEEIGNILETKSKSPKQHYNAWRKRMGLDDDNDDDLMGHGADVKMDPSETIKELYGHIARVHDETGEKFLVRILDMMEENYSLADETP